MVEANDISIHTPTKGATLTSRFRRYHRLNFNPHSHEGSDSVTSGINPPIVDFNPHSHEGSDVIDFNVVDTFNQISIHTPTKGATYYDDFNIMDLIFQSTLPRRERHTSQYMLYEGKHISIHTPTKGAT